MRSGKNFSLTAVAKSARGALLAFVLALCGVFALAASPHAAGQVEPKPLAEAPA